jgi:hypothetical protein
VPLIKKNDKPIMGLVSAKNFVTANAVENILMQVQPERERERREIKREESGPGHPLKRTPHQSLAASSWSCITKAVAPYAWGALLGVRTAQSQLG